MESHSTPHRPSHYAKSERDDASLYPFSELAFNLNEAEEIYKGLLGSKPLHLTPPYGHEDGDVPAHTLELTRPVTPIEDEIKSQPKTLNKLAKLVRRRIVPQLDSPYLNEDEQKQLSAIIMGEVNSVWADFRNQVPDPFLSVEENKELHRQITVHLVTVCEKLFQQYLTKVHILNKRGVFSGPANMSRLKAQLALDASRLLNIAIVRRHLLRKMKGQEVDEWPASERSWREKHQGSVQPSMTSSEHKFDLRQQKGLHKVASTTSLQVEIEQMKASMPQLNAEKLMMIFHNLPEKVLQPTSTGYLQQREKIGARAMLAKRQKSQSVPRLFHGETLLQELGVEDEELHGAASLNNLAQAPQAAKHLKVSHRDHLNNLFQVPLATVHLTKDLWETPTMGRRERLAADLKSLVRNTCDDGLNEDVQDDEDLPPLLQTIAQSQRHDGKRARLEKQMQALQEREERRIKAETMVLKRPTHAQPTTVERPMPNKMVVRTNDVRVSERICLTNITLSPYATVYNDLVDEVDATTMKQMDSSLFLGDEISEVYKEIMKTVPKDHLDMENDVLVETPADSVNIAAAFASSSLSKRREDRVINMALQQRSEPPWGGQALTDWVKTPQNPPRDKKGQPLIMPRTPRGDPSRTSLCLGNSEAPTEKEIQAAMVEAMGEVMARSYTSWLSWWKNTVNSDDYMKYASAQDSDYLGVVFHFYDSADEDDNDAHTHTPSRQVTKQHQQEDKKKKMSAMWQTKNSYTPGEWNVQSVMLGGLGKDPELTEHEEAQQATPVPQDDKALSKGTDPKMKVITKAEKRLQSMYGDTGHETGGTHLQSECRRSVGQSMDTTQTKKEIASLQQCLQERLEKVWKSLHMPDTHKLDMAIKYSGDTYHSLLEQAVDEWERVADLIQQRELLLTRLEKFERLASDPNRFFEKGLRGSAVARLDEAKTRSGLYKKIEVLDVEITKVLDYVKKTFEDVVTYQGRVYQDKMKWDRTEMLYWLQEERKQQLFNTHSTTSTAHRRHAALKLSSISPTPNSLPPVASLHGIGIKL
ncbi:hypothetical protein NP493_368g02075 [Ridgeia piscesae]|uniref:Coiled-coil domain-containing protein 87-like n=1 Tax=Ridgeia piscesae TaxID=27915 RepID=A0AAD9L2Y6_RIDPI|nr:hypothetical protein NP493_368g02075 [Ridgeia piscesae]